MIKIIDVLIVWGVILFILSVFSIESKIAYILKLEKEIKEKERK